MTKSLHTHCTTPIIHKFNPNGKGAILDVIAGGLAMPLVASTTVSLV